MPFAYRLFRYRLLGYETKSITCEDPFGNVVFHVPDIVQGNDLVATITGITARDTISCIFCGWISRSTRSRPFGVRWVLLIDVDPRYVGTGMIAR